MKIEPIIENAAYISFGLGSGEFRYTHTNVALSLRKVGSLREKGR